MNKSKGWLGIFLRWDVFILLWLGMTFPACAISNSPTLGTSSTQNPSSSIGPEDSGSVDSLVERLKQAVEKRKEAEDQVQKQVAMNPMVQSQLANQAILFLRANPPVQQASAPPAGPSSSGGSGQLQTPPQQTTSTTTSTTNQSPTNNSGFCGDDADKKMMDLHNQHRADTSVKHVDSQQNWITITQPMSPLSVDCKLVQAAHNHSQWMSNNGVLGHCEDKSHPLPPCPASTGPDWQCSQVGGVCLGQNAASASDDPSTTFNLWLEYSSPVGGRGHHANIDGAVPTPYTAIGCSHAGGWWTCNFR